MARSTPAQKPRGSARTTSSRLKAAPSLQHADQLDLETHGAAGERVVEIEDQRIAGDLAHHAGEARLAVRRREANDVADPVVAIGVAMRIEHRPANALD